MGSFEKVGIYDWIDEACASILCVSVDEYIYKIEKTTEKRRFVVVGALLSEDENLINKGKRIFNLINLN